MNDMKLTIIFDKITEEELKLISDTLDELKINYKAIPEIYFEYNERGRDKTTAS
jgi:hypothetical protein